MKNFMATAFILRRLSVLLIAALMMTSGCSHFAKKPLKTLSYFSDKNTSSKNLFIFMRGLGGSHRSFEKEGLVEVTWQRGKNFDMMAPNAHFAYYAERTLIERLREDIILPAKEKGYENIWLIGFSMGGLGSLLYYKEYPEDISGVCLISPFLGFGSIIEEIYDNGGLKSWVPGDYSPEEDWQRMLWHWIKVTVADDNSIPIFLGFGNKDLYVDAHRLLTTALPEDNITRMEGAHDYKTFKALWLRFLDRDVYLAH